MKPEQKDNQTEKQTGALKGQQNPVPEQTAASQEQVRLKSQSEQKAAAWAKKSI